MILLDTNVLSELMKRSPNQQVVDWLDNHPSSSLFISAITRAEIELGISMLPEGRRKQALRYAGAQLFTIFSGRCLAFDASAAVQYGLLVAQQVSRGKTMSVEDAQIAAIALVNDLQIATRNSRDFEEISNLRLINPWQ